jgi:hypothetical protein
MGERPEPSRSRIEELSRRVESLERRLSALEGRAPADGRAVRVEPPPPRDAEGRRLPAGSAADFLTPAGRTLVVLGGAFVLRAATDAEILPRAAGPLVGLAYAVLWVVFAELAARRGRPTSAIFHGLAASLIAFPLLFEAAVTFRTFAPALAAAALATVVGLLLALAARWKLAALGWIATLGGAATALVLLTGTRTAAPIVLFLFALMVGAREVGWARRWTGLGEVAAAFTDGVLLLLCAVVLIGDPSRAAQLIEPEHLVALLVLLPVVSYGGTLLRVLVRRIETPVPEAIQAAVAVILGLGGAAIVARASGAGTGGIGIVGLALGAGAYWASFLYLDRSSDRRRNFAFHTSMGLAHTIVGLAALVGGAVLAVAYGVASLAAAFAGARWVRATLSLHGAIYLLAAALASGLLAASVAAMAARSLAPSRAPGGVALGVLAVAGLLCLLPVSKHGRTLGRLSGLPKALMLAVFALGASSLAVWWALPALVPAGGDTADAGRLALFRTGALAAAAIALAFVARWERLQEGGWLVYPVLLLGGLKLVVEDLRLEGAALLVVSFLLYGGALILAPGIARRSAARAGADAPGG